MIQIRIDVLSIYLFRMHYVIHNYLVCHNILSIRHLFEGGHFENGPYNIVYPK